MLSNKYFIGYHKNILNNLYICRSIHENYYEVLKLPRDCTSTDVRKAFIDLSKQCHPDKDRSSGAHTRFVRVLQAYQTLSVSARRAEYDLGLPGNIHHHAYQHRAHPVYKWEDLSFYGNCNQQNNKQYEYKSYYGTQGINKVSTSKIVLLCVGFMIFGIVLQSIIIWKSFVYGQKVMDKKSAEAGAILSSIRAEANNNGNDVQLQRLVTTMSRGHS